MPDGVIALTVLSIEVMAYFENVNLIRSFEQLICKV
jgi:hypothetical protein